MTRFIVVERRSAVIPIEAANADEARDIASKLPLGWDEFDISGYDVEEATGSWLIEPPEAFRTRADVI